MTLNFDLRDQIVQINQKTFFVSNSVTNSKELYIHSKRASRIQHPASRNTLILFRPMKRKKISISDIARKLRVSPTTVSFVLNGRSKEKRVSEEVVRKIKNYVEKVGYKPNTFAQSLRTGKSRIIGLMIEDISNPFFASVAKLIEDRAYQDGYKIMYCSTHNDQKKARDLIKMFK